MNSCQYYVCELWSDIYVALIREEISHVFASFRRPPWSPPPPPPRLSLSLEYRRIPVDVIVYIIFCSLAYKLTYRKSRRLLYK